METQIAKWGNSLALRIPRSVAAEANVQEGDPVEVSVQDGAIVVRATTKRFTLAELVADITPRNRHSATDWGPPRGNESW
jgi:antitoxin MazE